MAYELWDTEFNNLLADFSTEEEALAVVRKGVEARGVEAIAPLALGYEDEDGETHFIAAGVALAERAQRAIAIR